MHPQSDSDEIHLFHDPAQKRRGALFPIQRSSFDCNRGVQELQRQLSGKDHSLPRRSWRWPDRTIALCKLTTPGLNIN